jgi:hypothetical protein
LIGMTKTSHRLITVLAATVSALAAWTLTGPLLGVDIAVRSGGSVQTVGPVAVAVTSLLAGLAAWGLLALFERFLRRPARAWTIVALIVLALSLAGPLTSADGADSRTALLCLHCVVAVILIPGLARSSRRVPATTGVEPP